VAESFGSDAERYDRTRPRYPDAMVDRIVAASPGPDMLDVGCGTGIEARQFQAAGGAGGRRGRYRRDWGELHDALHHGGGHCAARTGAT